MKIQVSKSRKKLREDRIKEIKKADQKKVTNEQVFELLVKTNERLEEIYDTLKLGDKQ